MSGLSMFLGLMGLAAFPVGVVLWIYRKLRKQGRASLGAWIALGGVVAFIVGICIPGEGIVRDTSNTLAPTHTSAPTNTPGPPTNTPEPTSTSAPTATPTPALLTARDIELKRKELTDLQWDKYTTDMIGEEIRFSGKVVEVYDDARIHINFASAKGLLTRGILHGLSVDQALTLQKDQVIKGIGTIRKIELFLGLSIDIDVTALE